MKTLAALVLHVCFTCVGLFTRSYYEERVEQLRTVLKKKKKEKQKAAEKAAEKQLLRFTRL